MGEKEKGSVAMETDTELSDKQLQVRLVTKVEGCSVPDNTLSVPQDIDSSGLNALIQGLLCEGGLGGSAPEFDWLCLGEILRSGLAAHLATKQEAQHTGEAVIEVEYIEKNLPPQPQVSVNHDDWVSSVCVSPCGSLVLSGCYDNTVNIWEIQQGVGEEKVNASKKLVIPGHIGPVKAVQWVSTDSEGGTLLSASQDQTIGLYRWSRDGNSVVAVNSCRGHERSVECLAVQHNSHKLFASGGFDNTIKVWGCGLVSESEEGASEPKRAKGAEGGPGEGRAVSRTPVTTLGGHKEAVGGLAWLNSNQLASASWDHTIKVWDTELGGLSTELVGNKAFFSISFSLQNNTILASGADRSVRLYDPRSTEGSVVKAMFTSHTGWVTRVSWAEKAPNQFISSSHDQLVKVWDQRSHKTPLYELTGHSDKVLCCDWSNQDYIVSGGADNDMKIFKSKVS